MSQPMQVDVVDLDDGAESDSSSIMLIDDPTTSAPTKADDTARHVTRFDFKRQIAAFLEEIRVRSAGDRPQYIPQDAFDLAFAEAFTTETTTKLTAGRVLEGLSRTLGVPGLTELFIKYFRPVLLDLVARWILAASAAAETTPEEWERKLFVVAELAQHVPEAWSYVHSPCRVKHGLTCSPPESSTSFSKPHHS